MAYKLGKIELKNFAEYVEVEVSLNSGITYLVGKNGSGKTTLGLTGVQFIMQGIAERATDGKQPVIGERFRFIGPNGASAKGSIVLYDEKKGCEITVTRKLTKDGQQLSFDAPEGMEIDQKWLNDLFELFLISPKKFYELPGDAQAKTLGIDTKKIDDELKALKLEYTKINAVYSSFGQLVEPEKVDKIDVTKLREEKELLKKAFDKKYEENKEHNKKLKHEWEAEKKIVDEGIQKHNDKQAEITVKYNACFSALGTLKAAGYEGDEVQTFLNKIKEEMAPQITDAEDQYPKEPDYIPEMPDDSEIQAVDKKIADAAETNSNAVAYEQYLVKKKQKDDKKAELDKNKADQEAKGQERIDYIKAFKFPFKDLSVDDDGALLLQGKPIKPEYFSTGELLKVIPVMIASQNPEFKYVFIQDFNLLDEDTQRTITEYLVGLDFQLVLELVGKEKIEGKNCILLKDNVVVESYEEPKVDGTGQASLL